MAGGASSVRSVRQCGASPVCPERRSPDATSLFLDRGYVPWFVLSHGSGPGVPRRSAPWRTRRRPYVVEVDAFGQPSGPITDHRPSIRNAESPRIQQCSGWCRYTVANMVVPTTLDVASYSRYYTGRFTVNRENWRPSLGAFCIWVRIRTLRIISPRLSFDVHVDLDLG